MARPSKPAAMVQGHRTKDELKIRRDAEAATLTGTPMKMRFQAKDHAAAAKEFRRLKKLLAGIGKDDDLYSLIISTHCLLIEECEQMVGVRDQFICSKSELQEAYRNGECGDPEDRGVGAAEYYRLLAKISQSIINCDKEIMSKRKMILDIDRENILTVQSALRSVPKKPEKKEKSRMAVLIERRAGDG